VADAAPVTAAVDDRAFATQRLVAAPRALVFEALRDPRQLARWWGPAGFTNTFEEFDFRPGGHWRFVMHGPDGSSHANQSVFVETEEERVVFDHLSGHGFRMTITLVAQDDGHTLVQWRQVFDSAEERERIAAFVIPANEQNLDRLEALLGESASRDRSA
jgi:uncharacterized protein YndB with AHSA1/START domain